MFTDNDSDETPTQAKTAAITQAPRKGTHLPHAAATTKHCMQKTTMPPTDDSPEIIDITTNSPAADDLDEGTKRLVLQRRRLQPKLHQQLGNNLQASKQRMVRNHARRKHSTAPSAMMPPDSLGFMKVPATSKLDKKVDGPYLLREYITGQDAAAAGSSAAAADPSRQPEARALL